MPYHLLLTAQARSMPLANFRPVRGGGFRVFQEVPLGQRRGSDLAAVATHKFGNLYLDHYANEAAYREGSSRMSNGEMFGISW